MQTSDIYFGENLNRVRTDKGITVERLADKSGVSVATIKSWQMRSVVPWMSYAADMVNTPRLTLLRS